MLLLWSDKASLGTAGRASYGCVLSSGTRGPEVPAPAVTVKSIWRHAGAERTAGLMADIEWSADGGVGTILLNRPASKNAFTPPMLTEWARMLARAGEDESVRVVIVTGAGDAFCAGADLKHLGERAATPAAGSAAVTAQRSLERDVHQVAYAMESLSKPVIAAVNGAAVGAGMDMALMCDFRFAATTARFSEAYVRVGLVPGNGGCYFLPRIVGVEKALELLLTGDFVSADEALRIGLVSRVVPPEQLVEEARGFAARLAAMPPVHVQLIKRNVYQSADADLRTSLRLAATQMGLVRTLADSAEALAAFRERRPGVYHGT
jgi:enoyl-CoA hydratase/carnithine racemase